MELDNDLEDQNISFLQQLDRANGIGHFLNGSSEGSDRERDWSLIREDPTPDVDKSSNEEFQSAKATDNSFSVSSVLSAGSYNAALKDAVSTTRTFASDLKQPWETGPMKFLFSDATTLSSDLMLRTNLPRKRQMEDVEDECEDQGHATQKTRFSAQSTAPEFLRCVKATADYGYIEKRRANRTLAICKISKIVEVDPERFSVGRAVLDEMVDGNFANHIFETVDMVLAMKSPGTINKRAGSMMLFLNWYRLNNDGSPFPITESASAKYLMSMRREEKFVSRGASFRESLRFFHYALGLDGALDACDSPRVKGAADVMLSGGEDWQPADPFTKDEVMKFHAMLEDLNLSALDRLAAGNVLTMIYGRCRASDLNHVQVVKPDMINDAGYLEFGTRFHKTSRNAKQKTKLLPIVLPVVGINGRNWVKTLLELRQDLGLPVGDLRGAPWWPAPAMSDDPGSITWCKRPVTSEEIGQWMQQVVGENCNGRKITSHSAKATCLSWLAKMGVGREDRDILGRHVNVLQGSGPLYSRDIISAPLRKLEDTLAKIAGKQFWPDHNRSGLFTPVPNTSADRLDDEIPNDAQMTFPVPMTPAQENVNVKQEETADDIISIHSDDFAPDSLHESEKEEASSCESVEDASDEEDEMLLAVSRHDNVAVGSDVLFAGTLFYKHRRSGICHTIRRNHHEDCQLPSFDCGRMLNDNYDRIEMPFTRIVKCSLCFKTKP